MGKEGVGRGVVSPSPGLTSYTQVHRPPWTQGRMILQTRAFAEGVLSPWWVKQYVCRGAGRVVYPRCQHRLPQDQSPGHPSWSPAVGRASKASLQQPKPHTPPGSPGPTEQRRPGFYALQPQTLLKLEGCRGLSDPGLVCCFVKGPPVNI